MRSFKIFFIFVLLLSLSPQSSAANCLKIFLKLQQSISTPGLFQRQSGVLFHITSLPGKYGIGEIGPEARRFADQLHEMDQKIWQMLPTGPTSFGNSPYQSTSSFANNHLLISIDELITDGYLLRSEAMPLTKLPQGEIDFGALIPKKERILEIASNRFKKIASASNQMALATYLKQNSYWIDDYAQFVALKKHFNGAPWYMWDQKYARRNKTALKEISTQLKDEIENIQIQQFIYQKQWQNLKEYCNKKEINIVGDIPIFVAHDSSDVWANQGLFKLNQDGSLKYMSGVPPDAFSETGQLWGNPLYKWEVHQDQNFKWWIERVMSTLHRFDQVRIDHFRGFESAWQVAGDATDAINGTWAKAPGKEFFDALELAYQTRYNKKLPIIIEDLGIITDEVTQLKNSTGLPGMNIVQFFDNPNYHPENFTFNSVAYTSTHDNQTMMGYLFDVGKTNPQLYQQLSKYTGKDSAEEISRTLIEKTLSSRANTAIIPIQDLLFLDDTSRMNVPGKSDGNWMWRLKSVDFDTQLTNWLKMITIKSGR